MRLDVSCETRHRLGLYVDLLLKWTTRINLVAPSSVPHVWQRHILDSQQLFEYAPQSARHWLDLGSGGGLPGAVIAILAAEAAPDMRVTCVEADLRKAVFLRVVSRETGVEFGILASRIEEVAPQCADVVSARALAPLPDLLAYALPHLAPQGICLFPKGNRHLSEIESAQKDWQFELTSYSSKTNPSSAVLRIGALSRA